MYYCLVYDIRLIEQFVGFCHVSCLVYDIETI